MQKPNPAVYTAAEFLDWTSSKSLVLSPKFQRRGVWQPAARSFFIDTLLRQMPVPPVYLRMGQSEKKDRVIREVIDGQQRISAVTSYMRDEYALSGALVSTWKGRRFSQLTEDEQATVRNYPFKAEVFSGITDAEVLEIFSRLNTYSVKLNAQELRNGRFFGYFKQVVYKLAFEHLEFWRLNGIFSERSIARMEEAELVSELLVASLAGLQDRKKSIDRFYKDYDEQFGEREALSDRFRSVMGEIAEAMPAPLNETEFNRRPLFYSLYTAVYHRMYGLPGFTEFSGGKKGELTAKDRERLANTVIELSDAFHDFEEDPADLAPDTLSFIEASLRHTDNVKPRTTRLAVIYKSAFA